MNTFELIVAVIIFVPYYLSANNYTIPIDPLYFDPKTIIDHSICENWTSTIEAINGTCSWKPAKLFCFGGMTNIDLQNGLPMRIRDTRELVLCGWPHTNFDAPSILKHFKKIRILRIEYSNLTHINNDFPSTMIHLENINISWTNFRYTRPTLFKKLGSLRFVDLRWNKLDVMEVPLIDSLNFKKFYLTGNPWNCTRNLKWLLNHTKGEQVADREQLKCVDTKYYSRPVMIVMQFKMNLKEACTNTELHNCSCTVSYVRPTDDGLTLTPMNSINCSRLNLYRLPSYLPQNTTSFYATDNKISNIEPLKSACYRSVQDVYLDYNLIQSIGILESDYWLENFRIFSLKGNKLTKLPVYLLQNTLEKNGNAAKLYLSQNPWRCDCVFTLRFQALLMKYQGIIKDSANVTCKYIEGDDNFGAKVLDLKHADVCKLPTEYKIKPLDLLNGVLASLIILVLGKLAYDYYHYRKSGRLPWIVTKLP